MADKKLSVTVSANTPGYVLGFGGAGGEVTYEAEWQTQRGPGFVGRVAQEAGTTLDDLREHVQQDRELYGDLFVQALNRAVQVSDDDYHAVLARLVAAARDSARIHEAAYLISQVAKLEPVHVRGLLATRDIGKVDFTREELAMLLKIAPMLARSVLQILFTNGLVTNMESDEGATFVDWDDWRLTDWGHEVLNFIGSFEA